MEIILFESDEVENIHTLQKWLWSLEKLYLVLIFTYEIVTDIDGNTSPGQVGVDEDRVRQGEAVLGHVERTRELVQQC